MKTFTMRESTVFDNLVTILSSGERKDLLEKLSSWKGTEAEVLEISPEAEEPVIDVKVSYDSAGLWTKVIIFFMALFTGKDALILYEERLLSALWKKIDRNYPALVSRESYEPLPVFYDELEALEKAAAVFANPLEQTLVRNKSDFIAFLAGMILEYAQEKLIAVTNLKGLPAALKEAGDKEFREQSEMKLDQIFLEITKEDRGRMYAYSSALNLLKEIVFFPFGDISARGFGGGAGPGGSAEVLSRLASILFGFREPLDKKILQALYIFSGREELEKAEADAEDRILNRMDRAVKALSLIRSFPGRLPLTNMLKLLTRNINYQPSVGGGGEDWFALYKQFWKRRLEHGLKRFFAERKKTEQYKEALAFVRLNALPDLSWYNSKTNEYGVSFKHEQSISFIVAFLEQVFQPEMNALLKLVLIDAQFYKEQNRTEFTDAYNGFLRLKERIKNFDASLSPEGSVGIAMAQVVRDFASGVLKTKRYDAILLSLEKQAYDIIDAVLAHGDSLMKVLYGILYGEVGGKYDTLSNRVHIGGRENKAILKSMEKIMEKLGVLIDQLKNFRDLEQKTT